MKKDDIKYVEIGVDNIITYKPMDPQLGNAEFVFCPQFIRGNMKTLFITAKQQNRRVKYWKVNLPFPVKVFLITSWIHKTNHPNIWREYWCSVHKAIAHEIYVPQNTNQIVFEPSFGDTLFIRFEKNEEAS